MTESRVRGGVRSREPMVMGEKRGRERVGREMGAIES
jgi:hypothetical protein